MADCVGEKDDGIKPKRKQSPLESFTKLSNGTESARIKAGVNILKHLHAPNTGNDEMKYALARLIRGLAASKVQAKIGFFSALVGLLSRRNVKADEIFQQVSKELQKGGGNSKTENADILLGQILLCGAVIRSNLYETLSYDDKLKVLELLVGAGKERSYLTLASYKFLDELFAKTKLNEFKKSIFPVLMNDLRRPLEEQDLDGLFLLIQVQNSFPQSLDRDFGRKAVFGTHGVSRVADIVTTVPRHSALKHPVFELVVDRILKSDLIVEFFEKLDENLTRPNRNKYLVATKLLSGIAKGINDATLVPHIITENYLQQTINMYKSADAKSKDKEFYESSHNLFESLVHTLKQDNVRDQVKIEVLRKLLFFPGTFFFEKITRSKLVQNITATLGSGGVKELAQIYRGVILASDQHLTNSERIYASHLLVKLLNHPSMSNESGWKIEQIVFLGGPAFFTDRFDKIGHELADSLKPTFYSSLDLKLIKLEDFRSILSSVVRRLDALMNENGTDTKLTEGCYGTWRKTFELAAQLESQTKKKRSAVFHVLFLHLSLQLFNNSKLASESLDELFTCYERSKRTETRENNSNDPLWVEVVVDLFLNLLSHGSHLLRSVINHVFRYLCDDLNDNALHQILAALDSRNEFNPLSMAAEESSEEEEDDDEDANSTGEESSGEDDSELDEEGVNDKLRMALQQVLCANPESDSESVDLDALDEEEGAKLDRALGQVFKQYRPNAGRKRKQNRDDETLMHFRIRVLDLIEIYLNSNPSMLSALEIMLPLLQLLEYCIRDDHQRPLRDRVNACLKKLTSLKKFSEKDDVSERTLVDLLGSLLEKGTRNMTLIQEMEQKIADCCTFIINCSQSVETERRLIRVIAERLEAYFQQRESTIPYVVFKSVLQLNWGGVFDLVPVLHRFVFNSSVRPFRRCQAVALLKLVYGNHRLTAASKQENIGSEAEFLRDALDYFREMSAGQSQVKEKFVTGLLDLLTHVRRGGLHATFEHWQAMGDYVRDFRSQFAISRDTKLAFNRFCKSLNISNVVEMKRQTVKLGNKDETRSKKKTKATGNAIKRQLKLKKEAKRLRLESLSHGLGKRKLDWEGVGENKKVKVSP